MASPIYFHHKSLTHAYWIYPLSLRLPLKCASGAVYFTVFVAISINLKRSTLPLGPSNLL